MSNNDNQELKFDMDRFGNITNVRNESDDSVLITVDSSSSPSLIGGQESVEEPQIIDQTPKYKNLTDKLVKSLNSLANESWFKMTLMVALLYPGIMLLLKVADILLGTGEANDSQTTIVVDGVPMTEEEYAKTLDGGESGSSNFIVSMLKTLFSFFVSLIKLILNLLAGN